MVEGELLVVEPKKMEHRRVEIVPRNGLGRDPPADGVGLPVGDAGT